MHKQYKYSVCTALHLITVTRTNFSPSSRQDDASVLNVADSTFCAVLRRNAVFMARTACHSSCSPVGTWPCPHRYYSNIIVHWPARQAILWTRLFNISSSRPCPKWISYPSSRVKCIVHCSSDKVECHPSCYDGPAVSALVPVTSY
jgi:hypothetical protein